MTRDCAELFIELLLERCNADGSARRIDPSQRNKPVAIQIRTSDGKECFVRVPLRRRFGDKRTPFESIPGMGLMIKTSDNRAVSFRTKSKTMSEAEIAKELAKKVFTASRIPEDITGTQKAKKDLRRKNLKDANFIAADFSRAFFKDCKFEKTSFADADLTKAFLPGVRITKAQLKDIVIV